MNFGASSICRHPPFHISELHTNVGEFFGIFGWLWFLHRARVDGAVNLGWRHAWEHDDDHDGDHSSLKPTHETWDAFTVKALKMNDDDDDDDEEEEEQDDENDED